MPFFLPKRHESIERYALRDELFDRLASLLVDFVLTLAVSMTVFAGYIGAMIPEVKPYKVAIAVAGILAMVGIKAIKKAKPVPEKAIRNAQETVAAIKPGS